MLAGEIKLQSSERNTVSTLIGTCLLYLMNIIELINSVIFEVTVTDVRKGTLFFLTSVIDNHSVGDQQHHYCHVLMGTMHSE